MKTLIGIAVEYGIRLTDRDMVTSPDWDKVLSLSENFRILETKATTSRWHQEKNMLEHTKMVCDIVQVFANSDSLLSGRDRLVLMLAAMFHDIGKCKCENSEDGRLLSNGHPLISERICRQELWGLNVLDRERICELVRWHDLYCLSDISDRKLLMKLGKLSMWLFIHIDLLFKLWMADDLGAIKDKDLEGSAKRMVDRIEGMNLGNIHRIPNSKTVGVEKEFTVYVMCGLPGSGKTTWCNDNLSELPMVSRDTIREELGMTEKGVKFMGTPEQEDLVSKISDERVLELCKDRQSFVYDNMNSREKYRRSFYDKIRKYKPLVRYIYLEVNDLSVLEARRPEIACKGDNVFSDMVYKMEFPRPDEYDTLEIQQNLSNPSDGEFDYTIIGTLHI